MYNFYFTCSSALAIWYVIYGFFGVILNDNIYFSSQPTYKYIVFIICGILVNNVCEMYFKHYNK